LKNIALEKAQERKVFLLELEKKGIKICEKHDKQYLFKSDFCVECKEDHDYGDELILMQD
jgi:hypothetical protein